MPRLALIASALCLLSGCGGGGYLPYASGSLSSLQIQELASQATAAHSLPPGLVQAVLMAESGGDPTAISVAGAQGLMQLMPATAERCGVDPFEPASNVDCGSTYLKSLLNRYRGNVTLAVAAYNAGPGAVDSYHGVPPYAETRAYVHRVLAAYRSY
jgi:soluble lytic murein transglycosylase-like protein